MNFQFLKDKGKMPVKSFINPSRMDRMITEEIKKAVIQAFNKAAKGIDSRHGNVGCRLPMPKLTKRYEAARDTFKEFYPYLSDEHAATCAIKIMLEHRHKLLFRVD